jgi:hypothetical protein
MDPFHLYEKSICQRNSPPLPADAEQNQWARDQVARALLNAAQLGECNTAVLSELAVAFGMRNWHLRKQ